MLQDIADVLTSLFFLLFILAIAGGMLIRIGLPLGPETGHTLITLAEALFAA